MGIDPHQSSYSIAQHYDVGEICLVLGLTQRYSGLTPGCTWGHMGSLGSNLLTLSPTCTIVSVPGGRKLEVQIKGKWIMQEIIVYTYIHDEHYLTVLFVLINLEGITRTSIRTIKGKNKDCVQLVSHFLGKKITSIPTSSHIPK